MPEFRTGLRLSTDGRSAPSDRSAIATASNRASAPDPAGCDRAPARPTPWRNVIDARQRPTLIMAHNKTLAAQLYCEFKEFFPNNAVNYFVSYYDYYQPEAYIARTDTYIEKDTADQRGNRSAAAGRDVVAVRAARCDHRGLGVVHLRHRQPAGMGQGDDQAERWARRAAAMCCCAIWSICNTSATTSPLGAASFACAATRWKCSPPMPRPRIASSSGATRSNASPRFEPLTGEILAEHDERRDLSRPSSSSRRKKS